MPPACAAVSASWTPYDELGSLFSKRRACAETRRLFDTEEPRRMDTAGNRLTRGSDNVEVHRVFIDLAKLCRSRNGKRKRLSRLAFPGNRFGPFPRRYEIWLKL